jgi:FkbM family methyltransferase
MMDFKELFRPDAAGNDETVIEKLRRSARPVLMYGAAADVGGRIAGKLAAEGLTVARIITDADCPPVDSAAPALQGVLTCTAEEADSACDAYHVIAGFVGCYGKTDALAQKFRKARSVDYLSEIFDMEPIRPAFVSEHRAQFEQLWECLADQRSKDSLVAYLLAKTRQDMKYIPPYFEKVQYFPADVVHLTGHESYFDCGAFTGDTVGEFLKAAGNSFRHIWAAEPDPQNCRELCRFVKERQLNGVDIIGKGIYSAAGRLPFRAEGNMLSMLDGDAPLCVDVETVDRIVGDAPVSYLKMDVEGAELPALMGAEQTIRANRPTLGISIYHRERDLLDIPAYIHSLVPEYRFYFRVHKKLAIDTVLYAVKPLN